MKKLLLVIALIFSVSTPSYAQTGCDNIEVNGMPEAVVIELKRKCVDLAKPSTSAIDVDSMGEYAELGKKYGVALSEVAKSIGTTVNELAQTPVGKFMLVMVAYRVMGDGVIGILGGIVWFSTMVPIWIYLFNKMTFRNRKTISYKDVTTGRNITEVSPVDFEKQAGTIALWFLFIMVLICIAGFFMIFG